MDHTSLSNSFPDSQLPIDKQQSQTHDSSLFLTSEVEIIEHEILNNTTLSPSQPLSKNLSMILAQRMPLYIRNQVIKMVSYYQGHMHDQLEYIHKIVEENNILKKKAQKWQQKYSQLEQQKQNRIQFGQDKENTIKIENKRIASTTHTDQLLICKNRQINTLNKEITELMMKVKKYKKRLYELQAKSPVKSTISQYL